jgi:hypothetical protein
MEINMSRKLGYPYFTDDSLNDDNRLSNTLLPYLNVISIVFIISFFNLNSACASDMLSNAGKEIAKNASNQTATDPRSWQVIGALLAADGVACRKAADCLSKLADKEAAKACATNPKVVAAVVCSFAIAWCARGTLERIANRHL